MKPSARKERAGAIATATVSFSVAALIGISVFYTSVQPITLYGLAVLAAIILYRFPWLLLLFVAIVDQYPSGSQIVDTLPGIATIGSSLYSISKYGVPATVGAAAVALFGAIVRLYRGDSRNARTPTATTNVIVVLAVATGLFYAAINILWSLDSPLLSVLTSSFGAAAMWTTILAGYAIAYEVVSRPGGSRKFFVAGCTVVVVKASIAVIAWITTGGGVVDGQEGVIFYGPVTPLLGTAVLAAWASGWSLDGWRERVTLAAGAICVVASFRITFIITAVVAVLIAVSISPNGIEPMRLFRRVAATTVVVAILALAVPTVGYAVSRFASLDVLVGTSSATTTSADLHNEDIKIGLGIAAENPIAGIGPYSPQPEDFKNYASPTVYVHNEYLQQWLRFGIVGLLSIIVLVVALVRLGRSCLELPQSSEIYTGASAVLLSVWLPILAAPFLSTTQGYPVAIGACAGLCEIGRQYGRYSDSWLDPEQKRAGWYRRVISLPLRGEPNG